LRTDGEDSFLDAGCEEVFNCAFADGQALRLHEVARVCSDLVELILEAGHDFFGRADILKGNCRSFDSLCSLRMTSLG
jgi:hypothetical protein